MATPKENPYLDAELRAFMRNKTLVDVYLKLNNMVCIRGFLSAINVDDRTPTITMDSLHRGIERRNILNLNHIASINTVGVE